jgi:hypothetical protein
MGGFSQSRKGGERRKGEASNLQLLCPAMGGMKQSNGKNNRTKVIQEYMPPLMERISPVM